MITIVKLTIANIRQKKFRSLLIVLSLILSVALIYSILSLSVSTTKIFEQIMKKEIGNAELMILPKENSGEQYVKELDLSKVSGIEYHIPMISAYGYYRYDEESFPVVLTGMSEKDFSTIYGISYLESTSKELRDMEAFIGKETASRYEVELGDSLMITISGMEYHFTISAILEDNNSLSYNIGNLKLLITSDTLNNILSLDGMVNGYYIKSTQEYGKTAALSDLEARFSDYQIYDVSDMSDYKEFINTLVIFLALMVMAVIMVSAFIIYSSFKIIAIDRMPLMGTLRSIGATRKMTVRTLLLEAAFYGISGGILGDLLGTVIIQGIMKMMMNNFGITFDNISYFNLGYILIALLLGIGLAVGSALIPIVKMSKKSIKSIMFSELHNEKQASIYKTVIGIILLIAGFVIFKLAPLKLQTILDTLGIIFVMIGGSLIIPTLSMILGRILSIILKPFYKDGYDIVANNIKNDRTMMNNIMLLAMGLGVILLINNFSSSVSSAVTDVYATGKMDALVYSDIEDTFLEEVNLVEGVEHIYTTKIVTDLTANGGAVDLYYIEGFDGSNYSQYAWSEFGSYLTEDIMEEFKAKRSIIISRFTARKYELSVGDNLLIAFDDKEANYKIIAVVPSIMNNGNMSFVNDKFLEEDAGINNHQAMYLNLSEDRSATKILQDIKELEENRILPIQTLEEMRSQNVKNNNMIFFMMKAISIIAIFIGVIGIFNNFTICFISRKKLYATMRSLGLSKMKTIQNMLSEAFICGLIGTIDALLLGTLLLNGICYLVEAMGIPADLFTYNIKDYLFVLISGIIISMISAILPAISIAKNNIVSGLRYE